MDSKKFNLCSRLLLNIIDNKFKNIDEIIFDIESMVPNIRVYIFEIDKSKKIFRYSCNNKKTENTFSPEVIFKTKEESIDRIIKRLKIQNTLIFDNIDWMEKDYNEYYNILLSQNIKSIVMSPIIIEDDYRGFIYIDSKDDSQSIEDIFESIIKVLTIKLKQLNDKEEQISDDIYVSKLYNEIKKATNSKEFKFVYQPKFNMITNSIIGAEVLIRWYKEDGTIIYPDKFINMLEENNLIYLIDYYAIEETMKKIKYWCDTPNINTIPLSINLSKSTFMRYNFVRNLESLLQKYDINPKYLEFEITEREYVEFNIREINEVIDKIRSFGIKVSLDDFGSGNSNISFSMSANLDIIKIDKSITDKIGKSKKIDYFLYSIIGLRYNDDIEFLVEGIETKEQCDLLIEKGYKFGQGYYYSKPIVIEELESIYLKI